jgi:hypothetical protein
MRAQPSASSLPPLRRATSQRRFLPGHKKISGQRAILAGRRQPTTFAAEGLSFRVRDGNGRFPLAMATRKSGWQHFTLGRQPCQVLSLAERCADSSRFWSWGGDEHPASRCRRTSRC